MRAKEVEVSVQKFLKILWATVSLLCLIISLWIIFDCFKTTPPKEKIVASYSATNTIDYKVYLKSNKFYERNYLEKNKKYIANIIDYIDVGVNYNYFVSVPSNILYTYNVVATITSEYESSGVKAELWSKTYQISPSKSEQKTSATGFQVRESIKIDYSMYDSLAKKFKEEYSLAADTVLTLAINIRSNTTVPDYDAPISEAQTTTLTIPLNKTVTDVTIMGNEPKSNNLTKTEVAKKNSNPFLLGVSIVVLLISTPMTFISFYKLFAITNVSQYIVEQKKILKNYAGIIAEVTTKPDLREIKIIQVKQFEDLINIEEELRIPILFYEFSEKNQSWFVITTDTQAYIYVLQSQSNNDQNDN